MGPAMLGGAWGLGSLTPWIQRDPFQAGHQPSATRLPKGKVTFPVSQVGGTEAWQELMRQELLAPKF